MLLRVKGGFITCYEHSLGRRNMPCEKVRGHWTKVKGPRKCSEACLYACKVGAGGGNRTHTPVKVADFKSAASTVPPPRLTYDWEPGQAREKILY